MEYWGMDTPADLYELGRGTWTLLHTMAAYYPEQPSRRRQEQTVNFLHALSQVFPCRDCAKDFQQVLKESPPRLGSRRDFAQWMCEAHNHVNARLGKPLFDCALVDRRWRAPSATLHTTEREDEDRAARAHSQ
jgi:FAD-linked sulfhydryl oxidase